MNPITPDRIIKALIFFIPFLFSLCFHEFAHGWVAKKKGDNTADIMGRLTLNPMVHADIVGTFMLPIFALLFGGPLFGWAKPVPVNSRNLRHPKNDMFWIALAGPGSNILLFVLGVVFLFVVMQQTYFIPSSSLMAMIDIFLRLNLYLAFFNLLPLHPLDGGKVIARFIPIKWDLWLEQHQMQMTMALMLLVIFGGLYFLALPVDWIVGQAKNLVYGL